MIALRVVEEIQHVNELLAVPGSQQAITELSQVLAALCSGPCPTGLRTRFSPGRVACDCGLRATAGCKHFTSQPVFLPCNV